MARIHLNPGVFAAVVDGDLVILDIAHDDYLCIPGSRTAIYADSCTGAVSCDPYIATALLGEGLGRTAPRCAPPRRPPPPLPVRQINRCDAATPSLPDLGAIFKAWRQLDRSTAIANITATARSGRERRDAQAAAALVASFRSLMPAFPFVGECLFQSRWLLDVLHARGLDADWVFGVRTHPFQAHCWLQVDDVSLMESPDYLAAFHPIMVI